MSDNKETEPKHDSAGQWSGPERRSGLDRRSHGVVVKVYGVNQHVFREGEFGDHAFIVKEGQVEIVKRAEGKEVSLGIVGAGEMFGEIALIDNEPRMASARVVGGPAAVYVISKQQFDANLAGANLFVRKLLKILVDHVRSASHKVSA
jgi:CRP-like cAMP-binding protein